MRRDNTISELMDDPDCNREMLLSTYKRFGLVNRVFSKWAHIYKSIIRPKLTDKTKIYTLLDVGCGMMDNSTLIQKYAKRDGFTIHITGIDPNPVLETYMQLNETCENSTYLPKFLHELDDSAKFDFVISNHLIHHLNPDEISRLLSEISERTLVLAIMNDIRRSFIALIGFSILTVPYMGWTFIHTDGRRSIRRSFNRAELSDIVPNGWIVTNLIPFRLLAICEKS